MQGKIKYFEQNRYGLVFRPALDMDNKRQIGRLIYLTDPYIYPYWIPKERQFINFIQGQLTDQESIFYYKHCYVAYSKGQILGLITLLEPDVPMKLEIDAQVLSEYPGNHHQEVYEKYFSKLLTQHQGLKADEIIISNFCVIPSFREKLVGTTLMEIILEELQKAGYRRIIFDCLYENNIALRLYERVGCKIIGEDLGFGGDKPQPRVVLLEKILQ